METTTLTGRESRGLIVVLVLVSLTGVLTINSCGGSSSSNGELCDQCGDDPDGPCQPSQHLEGGPAAAALCNDGQACTVTLTCLRKLGSAQRRCFPSTEGGNVAQTFECDGSRPNLQTLTPMRTPTRTPTPESTPTPGCGNGQIDDELDEACDGADLGDETCDSLCTISPDDDAIEGTLACSSSCTFTFAGCISDGFDDCTAP